MKKIVLFYLLSIVFLMNSIAGYAQGENWRKITEMPKARWGSGSCVLDGKIYVVGGCYTTESSPGKPAYHTVAMVNSFDPETGVWDTLAPLKVPRCYLQAVVVNGKIYAIGGSVNIFGASSSTVEVYDMENDRWENSHDMPAKRLIFGACVLENQIYVMGGIQSFATVNNPLKSMDRFDPATGIWETCAEMSRAASGLTVAPYKGKIYAIGGGVVGNNGMDIVEEYDPAEDVWIRKTSMSAGRIFPCSAIVNDRIYVTGGSPPNSNITQTEIYNPLTDTWLMAAGEDFLPLKSSEFSCVALDKKLYAFGGAFGSPIHWSDPDVVEFDFPVARRTSDTLLMPDDTLKIRLHENGKIYITPEGTPAITDSIITAQLDSFDNVMGQEIEIPIKNLEIGTYYAYGISEDGRLDRAENRFRIKKSTYIDNIPLDLVKLYPNPANDLITIETGIPGIYIIDITTLNGQLRFIKVVEGFDSQIDLSSFQSGVYFISISSKDYVTTRKILKL